MQVTNSAVIADYFPEAFIAESDDVKGMKVVVKRFIRRITFRATGQKSYSTIIGIEAKHDWQARIMKGAEVTDFNLEKMPASEYMPLACWFTQTSFFDHENLHTTIMWNKILSSNIKRSTKTTRKMEQENKKIVNFLFDKLFEN